MKKLLIAIGAVFLLAIIGGVLLVMLRQPASETPTPSGSVTLPSAEGTENGGSFAPEANTLTIPAEDGTPIVMNDFIRNGETIEDPLNKGIYILAGSTGYCLPNGTCPKAGSARDFSISYNQKTQSFTITLLAEPLGSIRSEAEQLFKIKLGIFDERLCSLDYYVGTPAYVNAVFSGKNLGFNFCKDTTKLPG